MICPLCSGIGNIVPPKERTTQAKKVMVESLHNAGYGIRETQRLVGYKSPRSVQDIVNKLKQPYESKTSHTSH